MPKLLFQVFKYAETSPFIDYNHALLSLYDYLRHGLFLQLLFSTLLIVLPQLVFAQEEIEEDTASFAQIVFEKADYNFGDLKQGEKADHLFYFSNDGNSPLILNNVLSTCGCTVPEWPREPILADSSSVIKVVFDSTSKIGRQNKVVTIRSNSKEGDSRLRISAMVLPPEKSKNK